MELEILENEESYLKGDLKGYPNLTSIRKFNSKGEVLRFPGCSIIFKINKNSDLFFEIKRLQNYYKKLNLKNNYFYLPSSSFHVTLFDCCNIETLNSNYWPKGVKKKNNYKEITNELYYRIKEYRISDMFYFKIKKIFGGYSVILEGNTKNDEKKTRLCRDKLSDLLKIKFKNHKTYYFHITIAYLIKYLSVDDSKRIIQLGNEYLGKMQRKLNVIQLSKPEFCVFKNMLSYNTVKYLY